MTNTADELTEQTVASRQLFSGRLLGLRIDTVRLPEGMEVTREIVEHPGAAAVVPLTDDGQVLLVRQWRHPIGAPSLEIPAGTLDGSESPQACAERELCEEIGFSPEVCTDWVLSTCHRDTAMRSSIFMWQANCSL
jgi:ADP-ribose pyrophosphatase